MTSSEAWKQLGELLEEAGAKVYIAFCRRCGHLAHATGPCAKVWGHKDCVCVVTDDYGPPEAAP